MSAADHSGSMPMALDLTRQEFYESTMACRISVLNPDEDLGLSPALRAALAARMCRLLGDETEAQQHAASLPQSLQPLAGGEAPETLNTAEERALARHVDLITARPGAATRADIEALAAAGFSTPQIVALSELVAFVNYNSRVTYAHSLLEGL